MYFQTVYVLFHYLYVFRLLFEGNWSHEIKRVPSSILPQWPEQELCGCIEQLNNRTFS